MCFKGLFQSNLCRSLNKSVVHSRQIEIHVIQYYVLIVGINFSIQKERYGAMIYTNIGQVDIWDWWRWLFGG